METTQDSQAEYRCEQCDELWEFFPEDYDSPEDWPIKCPLCTMPLSQMVRDVYKEEGIIAIFKRVYLRYF